MKYNIGKWLGEQMVWIISITILLSIIIFNFTAFKNPDKIQNTILIKDTTMVVMEYIPRSGNLFTSTSTWHDTKRIYYYQNKKGGINDWSNDWEWRPYFYTLTTYQYYDNTQPRYKTDTVYFESWKYEIKQKT